MTLKVLLVDDESLARSRMRTLLADCTQPRAEVTGEAADSAAALSLMRQHAFDVALLDINMPGLSGVALAHALRTFPSPPAIVFVTAHTEHATTAFDMDAADYLTKPVRLDRLQKALQKAAMQRSHTQVVPSAHAPSGGEVASPAPDVLVIHERNRVIRVPVGDILLIKAELKYLTVCTASASYLADGTLADLEQRWGDAFVRTHRSVLVARRAMHSLERSNEAGSDGWSLRVAFIDELVPVSRRLLPSVRQAMNAS